MRQLAYLFAIILSLFLISCNNNPEYNLNIAPPPANSWPEDIYPAQIDGISAKTVTKDYGGTEASYGTDKSIYIARFENKQEAIEFFKQSILPEFEIQSSSFRGIVKDQFYARAKEGNKKFFGWVNQRYVFVLKANSEKSFDLLVNNFKYISKKK